MATDAETQLAARRLRKSIESAVEILCDKHIPNCRCSMCVAGRNLRDAFLTFLEAIK